MPGIIGNWGVVAGTNRLLNEQLDFNREQLADTVVDNTTKFNDAQRGVYDAVMESVNNNNPKMFFLHSAGGCGKTFVCNTIAAAVCAQGKIALCVASSGIASLLLDHGCTAHSTFHIPLQLNEVSTCNITQNSHTAALLKETSIIIWDEVPMQHKHAIEAVDRTIQGLLDNNSPFGGNTVLFGGDFCQILPVIPHGNRQQVVSASIRQSTLWYKVKMHHLHQNMHLEQTPEMEDFAAWLLTIGAGTGLDNTDKIAIPPNILCANHTINSLVNGVYPDIDQGKKDDQYSLDQNILACTNSDVMGLNAELLERFSGEKHVLLGADSVEIADEAANQYQPYAVEYLNSLVSSSLPLPHLELKVGCPVMLLRNLDPPKGLCNGT